jgi:hypothetical protein
VPAWSDSKGRKLGHWKSLPEQVHAEADRLLLPFEGNWVRTHSSQCEVSIICPLVVVLACDTFVVHWHFCRCGTMSHGQWTLREVISRKVGSTHVACHTFQGIRAITCQSYLVCDGVRVKCLAPSFGAVDGSEYVENTSSVSEKRQTSLIRFSRPLRNRSSSLALQRATEMCCLSGGRWYQARR